MSLQKSLFIGERVRFAPIDHDYDAAVQSRWSHDAEYLQMLGHSRARPLSLEQMKKKIEELEKEIEEKRSLFHFMLHTNPMEGEQSQLIGFAQIYWLDWTNGNAFTSLGIGERQKRGLGLGTEALHMILRYAFRELNLRRLSAIIPEYNQPALRLFAKCGFKSEVRRRQALHRNGRRWDLIHVGILREEWESQGLEA